LAVASLVFGGGSGVVVTVYGGRPELPGDGLTGFMPPALPDAAWVLNAMYEHEQGPAEVSYQLGNCMDHGLYWR
jgi:hypothetical protein